MITNTRRETGEITRVALGETIKTMKTIKTIKGTRRETRGIVRVGQGETIKTIKTIDNDKKEEAGNAGNYEGRAGSRFYCFYRWGVLSLWFLIVLFF